jgi:hypothetical protein
MSSGDTPKSKKLQVPEKHVTKALAWAGRAHNRVKEKAQVQATADTAVLLCAWYCVAICCAVFNIDSEKPAQQFSEKSAKAKKFYEDGYNLVWFLVGVSMVIHGCNFTNLFLCVQVIAIFCWGRLKDKTIAFNNHLTTGLEKKDEGEKKEDEDKEPKDETVKEDATKTSKHAQKRATKKSGEKEVAAGNVEEDAAVAKERLKAVDANRLSQVIFEYGLAFAACHMAMEGGLGAVITVTYAIVRIAGPKIKSFLDFEDCDEPVREMANLILSFLLYASVGIMAYVATSFAIMLNVCLVGSALVLDYGLLVPQIKGKVDPEGKLLQSTHGTYVFLVLVLIGLLKQTILPGMAWYFKLFYIPFLTVESVVDCF